jgi:hypothetical protein
VKKRYHFEDQGIGGRKEMELFGVDWVNLAQDTVKWRTVGNGNESSV